MDPSQRVPPLLPRRQRRKAVRTSTISRAQLWAYFQPFGVRFSTLFPFITPPRVPCLGLSGR